MFIAMNKLLAEENLRQNVTRNTIYDLETWITCLTQSSISPDILKEIKTLLDVLADNSRTDSGGNMNNERNKFTNRLEQLQSELKKTEEYCAKICNIVDNISGNGEINKELQKQFIAIKQIQEDNKMHMNEISR